MLLVLLAGLLVVDDNAPSEVHLAAATPDAASASSDGSDALRADRVAQYDSSRASRSEAQARTFLESNLEATTTTTEPPTTTAAPTTTTTVRPTTTTAAPTTTTTARPTTTSTMGPPPDCCRQEGGASYHDYADPTTCAHRSLPKGTSLRVTNKANGKTTTCVVNDRGPYVAGRILDLSKTGFTEIANVSDGVIQVVIEWSA